MSRLSLVSHGAPGLCVDARMRESTRRYVDLYVGGRSLGELVSEPGETVTALCEQQPASGVAYYAEAMGGDAQTADSSMAPNILELLVCAERGDRECGDLECGVVAALVRDVGNTPTRDGFRWIQGVGGEEVWVGVEGAPFAFDLHGYEHLISDAPQEVSI